MSDEKPPPRKPPLPHRVIRDISQDSEEIYIPPAPETERLPVMPRPSKTPRLEMMPGRPPSYIEFAASLEGFKTQVGSVSEQMAIVLATQRKMAVQLDGYGTTVNQRFDIFHKELAMLRATVTGDHAPRLDEVEGEVQKVSKAQQARQAMVIGGKYAAYATAVAVIARLAGKAFPQFGEAIEGVLGVFGL